jgi:glutamate 5-kinase
MRSDSAQSSAKAGRRVVVKFGTGILTRTDMVQLDTEQFERLTAELAEIQTQGTEIILVSSGAVGAGLMALGLDERPDDLPTMQACAAIGQSRLMEIYSSCFEKHGLLTAQLLLTHSDLDSRERYLNARRTLNTLLQSGRVIPIINENDVVATEELPRARDNDRMAAEVSILVDADLLVILSGIEGLTRNPDGTGEPIPEVQDITEVLDFVADTKGRMSRGGMRSKIQAVNIAVTHGVRSVIANGRKPGQIAGAIAGEQVGTVFLPNPREAGVNIPVY